MDTNGHEGSCEDDDDRDSVDTPCSCEDMHCTRRKWRENTWKVQRNGDCDYVGKSWSSGRDVVQNGTSSCSGDKGSHIHRRDDEEEVCSDCLSASSSNSNGGKKKKKGKKKKRGAKNDENKVRSTTETHNLLSILF